MPSPYSCDVARREVLRLGLYAGGLAALGVPMSVGGIARAAEAAASGRILVVVELSGANDGLNTVVPFATTPTIAPGRGSASAPTSCARSTTRSASSRQWPGSSGSIRMARWRSCTASATINHRSPIFPPWRTGTRERPTAAPLTAGSAASPTAWIRSAPPTIWSTSTRTSRLPSARAAMFRSSSTIRINSCEPPRLRKRVRCGPSSHRGKSAIRPSASCSRSPTARRMPSRACGRRAPSIARRSTMGWCGSDSTRWQR